MTWAWLRGARVSTCLHTHRPRWQHQHRQRWDDRFDVVVASIRPREIDTTAEQVCSSGGKSLKCSSLDKIWIESISYTSMRIQAIARSRHDAIRGHVATMPRNSRGPFARAAELGRGLDVKATQMAAKHGVCRRSTRAAEDGLFTFSGLCVYIDPVAMTACLATELLGANTSTSIVLQLPLIFLATTRNTGKD